MKDSTFKCGSLIYTKKGIAVLFGWLLWGDFCFTLMETVIPSILPLKLKSLQASNTVMALIMTTIPSVLNISLNPLISFQSDRFRSRWGRRIPFLMGATPFLCVALILMGFSDEVARFLYRTGLESSGISQTNLTLVVIGLLMICFQFFNMFISTVFWYFFNDVVPPMFMARFLGLFRVVGTLASTLYNYFIFKHAETHMREIFMGAGLLYFTAFVFMCWKVKEGEYPDPPVNLDGKKGFWASAKTYIIECTGHSIYRYYFLSSICTMTANACGVFGVFLPKSMGISLEQLGKISTTGGIISLVLTYPAAALADRLHPMRVFLFAKIWQAFILSFSLIWIFKSFDPKTTYWIYLTLALVQWPTNMIVGAILVPMQMRLLPKERFGQFASANAFGQSVFSIFMGLVAGKFLDLLQKHYITTPLGADFAYRYMPLWLWSFILLEVFFFYMTYRKWKHLGGKDFYVPPIKK